MGIIVVDVGTSSLRSILYSDAGVKLYTSQIEYSPTYLENDWVEEDPAHWTGAMEKTITAAVAFAKEQGHTVGAVSITSQRSSIIPIGEDDQPLCNAIMWQDKRVLGIIQELQPHNDRVFSLCGSRLNPVFSGSKMAWLRRNRPELYEKANRIVVIPDLLVHTLTGEWVTDATYGSRSLLMNLEKRQWDPELLEIFGVDKEKLNEIREPGSIVGHSTAEYEAKTGLLAGTPVVSAGGDQQCAALGLGVVKEGILEVSAGTGAYIIAASDKVPTGLKQDVICNASAIPGAYVLESSIPTCASAFNWLLRICYGMNESNKKDVLKQVNQEIEESLNKKSDVMILPHFQGRGTPDWNSHARGSIHNLNLGTTRGDIARAMFEGLCMEVEANVSAIAQYIEKTESIYACGGLANSPSFTQLLSNITELPIQVFEDTESTGLGAWMSGAVATGLYESFEAAFKAARENDPLKRIEVQQEALETYRARKQAYSQTYHAKA